MGSNCEAFLLLPTSVELPLFPALRPAVIIVPPPPQCQQRPTREPGLVPHLAVMKQLYLLHLQGSCSFS